jgi:hypothetical protein
MAMGKHLVHTWRSSVSNCSSDFIYHKTLLDLKDTDGNLPSLPPLIPWNKKISGKEWHKTQAHCCMVQKKYCFLLTLLISCTYMLTHSYAYASIKWLTSDTYRWWMIENGHRFWTLNCNCKIFHRLVIIIKFLIITDIFQWNAWRPQNSAD